MLEEHSEKPGWGGEGERQSQGETGARRSRKEEEGGEGEEMRSKEGGLAA